MIFSNGYQPEKEDGIKPQIPVPPQGGTGEVNLVTQTCTNCKKHNKLLIIWGI